MKVNLRSAARSARANVQHLKFSPVRYSTAEFSKKAGKPAELIRKACQLHGHYLGVGALKDANGRLSFDSHAVNEVCGLLPPARTAVEDFRDKLCAQTGLDPFPAHKFAAHVLRESPIGDTARARFENFAADLRDFEALAAAFGKRLGDLMRDEEAGTPDDWRLFNYYADLIERAAQFIVNPLRWRTA